MGESSAIALVGMSCRTPNAGDPAALWELLRAGSNAIREAPDDRWPWVGSDVELAAGARYGGFIDRIDGFDCDFFGISPREAALMDPQQRLMLELCWEALEDAVVPPEDLRGTQTGVFVGSISSDYADLLRERGARAMTRHALTGLHRSLIANRVSYTLGLRGPSITVDTGQSSSLVAVHLACESLRRGESALALACGVHLNISSASALSAASFGGLSPDGRCFTFDARANGYVRGEGGGVVVLKPLSEAVAAGDSIYGVIRASAVNNDGGGDSLTAPSQLAQEEVLRRAYRKSGLKRGEVQYVELHGSATKLGDRVEAAALGAVLGATRPKDSPLIVGSIKTNIGHLEGAAGIVGLIKAALCIEHRKIPPSLNFQGPPAEIPLDALGLQVQQALGGWASEQSPLCAGVSSFGVGGTNCHVVLCEPPSQCLEMATDDRVVPEQGVPEMSVFGGGASAWLLSARDDATLRDQAARLLDRVDRDPSLAQTDIARTLAGGRQPFGRRAVVLGSDRQALLSGLRALAEAEPATNVIEGVALPAESDSAVFVFPGQGSQWAGMACELLDCSPRFADSMRACEQALAEHLQWSLWDVLAGAESAPGLDRIDVVQPVLFAMMVSLAEMWRACGVRPAAVVGHSQGEIAAAHIAGGLSLHDAARVVALRSRLLTALVGQGSVVSVAAPVEWVREQLERWDGRISIGGVNGSGSSVGVVGETQVLEEFICECELEGVRAREVPATVASHSPYVEPLREQLLDALGGIEPCSGSVPFYSTVTGRALDCADLGPEYWYRNMREPVQFERALRELHRDGRRTFVEISPHPLLAVGLRQTVEEWGEELHESDDAEELTVVGTLHRGVGGSVGFMRSLAEAWAQGVNVGWDTVLATPGARRVRLPTYPFQRRRHWFDQLAPVVETATDGRDAADPEDHVSPGEMSATDVSDHVVLSKSLLGRRLASAPRSEHRRIVGEMVDAQVAIIAGEDSPEDVESSCAFKDLGLDSRAAVELCNRLRTVTGLRLSAALMFDHPTPAALSAYLLRELTGSGAKVMAAPRSKRSEEPLAIVGMSCRLPGGVRSPEDLWELVSSGTDAIGGFPTDRGWDLEGMYDPDPDHSGKTYTREAGFLYDAAQFDAAFFGISPREALAMDPQQRLLLEVSWEAFEDAGIDGRSLSGSQTGVYAGINRLDYNPRLWLDPDGLEGYHMTGGSASVIAGRVSYVFGLQGPALTVDTACSSSLVALHLACSALRRGECSLALAGGVTVMATPGLFAAFSRQRALALDGRCKSFSSSADGTGWGEGVGVLLVERLEEAQRNGHRVMALVRGSAVNQDGASNGLTAPNGLAQQQVIRQALASSGLTAADVDVVEAHGTGTKVGDPIEANALLATYGQERAQGRPLWLGSVKSNIGHAQAAAGVAGVIKMVMAMQHGVLPKTLHVDEPSAEVDWSAGDVSLLVDSVDWSARETPRRAATSSYGISGTNAHVILEEAPIALADLEDGEACGAQPALLSWVLSARGDDALAAQAARLQAFLQAQGALAPEDVGLSLAGRSAFESRAVVLGEDSEQLLGGVAALARGERTPSIVRNVVRGGGGRLAYMFTGQGAQRLGMGAELYRSLPVFAKAFDEVCVHMDEQLGQSLRAVVMADGADIRHPLNGHQPSDALPDGRHMIDDTLFTQAGLFALELALYRLLEAWGVKPDFVIGHSIGEIVAACAAEVLSLEDACRLVAARGRLMASLPSGGAMVAIQASEQEVAETLIGLEDSVAIAGINGPSSVVISGDEDAVARAASTLEQQGRKTKRLRVSHAFHSPRMDGMLDEFRRIAESISFKEPRLALVSNLTGEALSAELCTADYWVRHVREPVRFADGVRWLRGHGVDSFLELGPDGVLSAMANESLGSDSGGDAQTETPITAVPVMRRDRPEMHTLQSALARVWVNGVDVDWTMAFDGLGGRRTRLPTYEFQREHYWIEAQGAGGADVEALGQASAHHPLLGAAVAFAEDKGWLFTGYLSLRSQQWLADHVVYGTTLLPGSALLELVLHVGGQVGCEIVQELTIQAPLVLPSRGGVRLQVTVGEPDEANRRSIGIYSQQGSPAEDDLSAASGWVSHAAGILAPRNATSLSPQAETPRWTEDVWPPAGSVSVDVEELYDWMDEEGLESGPAFRCLRSVWRRSDETFAEIALPDVSRDQEQPFAIHPTLLDGALQALGAGTLGAGVERDKERIWLPFSWSNVASVAQGESSLRVHLSPVAKDTVSLVAVDESERLVLSAGSLSLRTISAEQLRQGNRISRNSLFTINWAGCELARGVAGMTTPSVVIGAPGGALASALESLDVFADIASLGRQVIQTDGGEAPQTALVDFTSCAEESPTAVHARAHLVLGQLQEWLADERFSDSQMVVVTRYAIAAGAGEADSDLANSAVWGLVRSAQSENPGRFVLVDVDGEQASWLALPAALVSGSRSLRYVEASRRSQG